MCWLRFTIVVPSFLLVLHCPANCWRLVSNLITAEYKEYSQLNGKAFRVKWRHLKRHLMVAWSHLCEVCTHFPKEISVILFSASAKSFKSCHANARFLVSSLKWHLCDHWHGCDRAGHSLLKTSRVTPVRKNEADSHTLHYLWETTFYFPQHATSFLKCASNKHTTAGGGERTEFKDCISVTWIWASTLPSAGALSNAPFAPAIGCVFGSRTLFHSEQRALRENVSKAQLVQLG